MPAECHIELFWLPVGAGTHFQRASLLAYDWLAATVFRRPRATFVHAALKVRVDGRCWTLELMPVPRRQETEPVVTGAVGSAAAGRLRIFRYQLLCAEADRLPDEEWAIESPVSLGEDPELAARVLETAPRVPALVWGRRAHGTSEMWTSDSAIAWLLCSVGIDAAALALPPGTQAPGWRAGIEVAKRTRLPSAEAAQGAAAAKPY